MRQGLTVWIRLIVILLATIAVQPAPAQVENWEGLKLISPGMPVLVRTTDGKQINGFIRMWNPDRLTIGHRQEVSDIARADVDQIATRAGISRARRAAWAAVIGAGVGAVLYIGLCSLAECDVSYKLVGAA